MPSVEEQSQALCVPDIREGMTLSDAALEYAAAGWFVVPTRRGDIKNPGSVLGKGWDEQSSRDPDIIRRWFTKLPNVAGIALHMGPSGTLAIDVDQPEKMPDWFRETLERSGGPRQDTRREGKGMHYVFLQPPGEEIGNSGALKKFGCDVRGTNGVIVACPTPHPAADGQYRWVRIGPVPALPALIAELLRGSGGAQAPILPPEEADDVLKEWNKPRLTDAAQKKAAGAVAGEWRRAMLEGESRHETAVNVACWILKDARAGAYPAKSGINWLKKEFLKVMTEPLPGRRSLSEAMAESELEDIVLWAAAQANAEPEQEITKRLERTVGTLMLGSPGSGGFDPGPDVPEDEETKIANEANRQYIRLKGLDRAKLWVAAEDRVDQDPKPSIALDKLRAKEFVGPKWRMEGLWRAGGKILLSAQYKAGKTTMVGNVVKSAIDGLPFLDRFPCAPVTRRIAVLDFEMTEEQLQEWYVDLNIENEDRVEIWPLAGSTFNIIDPKARKGWADQLRDLDVEMLIVDPIRPILDSLGLDESHDAGRLLNALDHLVQLAGAAELMVVQHMGHTGERPRGDSAQQGWPSALWQIVREQPKDKERSPGANAKRYFSALGRGVGVDETELFYDHGTRLLRLGAMGVGRAAQEETQREASRKETRIRIEGDIMKALSKATEPRNQTDLLANIRGRYQDKTDVLDRMVEAGSVVRSPGKGKSLYYSKGDLFARITW